MYSNVLCLQFYFLDLDLWLNFQWACQSKSGGISWGGGILTTFGPIGWNAACSQWRNMDRRLKLENLNCLILEFFFSKIYFLDQIYWQALVRPFKWHIGKVCIISRKKVTESGKNVKKGLEFVLFHFFDNENGENIFFGPSQLKVPKRWVCMVLKVFQCLLKQKSYKPNKIFLDLLSTNWAFEPLWN